MITINNINVKQADCILVQFEKEGKYFNLLVDGAYKKDDVSITLNEILGDQNIQGVVVSHLDADHISGVLNLVETKYSKIKDAFLLFNKFDSDLISYKQAKALEQRFGENYTDKKLIKSYEESFSQELLEQLNGNDNFLHVRIYSLTQRQMKEDINQDIVNITILGPSKEHAKRFMHKWNKNAVDGKIINQSSIMLLLEFENKAVILSGDGYCSDIKDAIDEIKDLNKIHVIKAAHHGAVNNNDALTDLVTRYKVEHVFFTIDESKYNKSEEHPSLDILVKLQRTGVKMTCSTNIDALCTVQGEPEEQKKLSKYMEQQEKIEIGGIII